MRKKSTLAALRVLLCDFEYPLAETPAQWSLWRTSYRRRSERVLQDIRASSCPMPSTERVPQLGGQATVDWSARDCLLCILQVSSTRKRDPVAVYCPVLKHGSLSLVRQSNKGTSGCCSIVLFCAKIEITRVLLLAHFIQGDQEPL